MAFSNLRIGSKLGAAFGVLVLTTLFLGAVSLLQLGHINANTQDIATNWLPSVDSLGEMRSSANRLRRAEGHIVVASSPEEVESQIKKFLTQKAEFEQKVSVYAPLVTPGRETELFNAYKKLRDQYAASEDKLIAAAKAGDMATSVKIFEGESETAFSAMTDGIGRLSELNREGAKIARQDAEASYGKARIVVISSLAVAAGLAIFMGVWITRLITRPMADAVRAAKEISSGNLSHRVDAQGSDEVAELLRALEDMRTNLANVVAGVRRGADSVSTASAEIAQGNNDLSARTEQQASALEETAASMEELGSTVKQNADNARTANQLALSASTVATQGGEVVSEVVQTMRGINEASQKIADIISVIDGIAFQTNILALNAAVEAARAGEQGRGFAVVAGEVRTLAQRSAEAAKEIKSLITASVERVEQGSALVDRAGTTMDEVVTSIRRVTDIMGEISAASSEQSSGVAQVGEAITQMDQATQQNAALVEQSAAAAAALNSQAQELVRAVSVFNLAGGHGLPASSVAAPAPRAVAARSAPVAAPPAPKPLPAKAARPAVAKAAPASLSAPAKPAPKAASDDDWETF